MPEQGAHHGRLVPGAHLAPNPVVGDLYHELVYGDYKDFTGVMFPTDFHAHHDRDDDIEGQGPNVSGGYNSFGLTVSTLHVNVPNAAPAISEAARTATVPPVRVDVQALETASFYVGGGTHASIAVEFRDFITVFDAPLNEARSLAVIREVKHVIPTKPIKYVVSSHHHWDHLGGLRAYVASQNVTVVMQQNNLPYYAEVLWIRAWVLQPDRLALSRPRKSPKATRSRRSACWVTARARWNSTTCRGSSTRRAW